MIWTNWILYSVMNANVHMYCTLSLLVNIWVRDLVRSEEREGAEKKDHVGGVWELARSSTTKH